MDHTTYSIIHKHNGESISRSRCPLQNSLHFIDENYIPHILHRFYLKKKKNCHIRPGVVVLAFSTSTRKAEAEFSPQALGWVAHNQQEDLMPLASMSACTHMCIPIHRHRCT